MVFYNDNKAEFERENPTLTPSELTKFAMNKFRQMYPGKTNGMTTNGDDASKSSVPSAKRKINTVDSSLSGTAKLARFTFKKQ